VLISGSKSTTSPASETWLPPSFDSEKNVYPPLPTKTEFALNGHCFGENSYGKEKRPAIDTNDLLKYIRGIYD
jgi:hypothetical protein